MPAVIAQPVGAPIALPLPAPRAHIPTAQPSSGLIFADLSTGLEATELPVAMTPIEAVVPALLPPARAAP